MKNFQNLVENYIKKQKDLLMKTLAYLLVKNI